jgi:hypothetical protein
VNERPRTTVPPARRYQGYFTDSARWERFAFRFDDVVITTPSKSGTTWMQTIVGLLIFGRRDLGAPISVISPWLDMLIHTDEQVFGLLEAQTHRRFIKTHTPLDGIPRVEGVTYVAVVRHPLDIALSDLDHAANMREDVAVALRTAAAGEPSDEIGRGERPSDPAEYLRWFIDNDEQPCGSGPYGLEDYCQQVLTYWDARQDPQVHLFHYAEMWADLEGQMRRLAEILGVELDEGVWPELVDAATMTSMRARASETVPNAHQGLWVDPAKFYRAGGTRDWGSLLTPEDRTHFEHRMADLAGDAAPWALGLGGRGATPHS